MKKDFNRKERKWASGRTSTERCIQFPRARCRSRATGETKLKFSSKDPFTTDPFAFICGSVFFASLPFAATVIRLLATEAARRQ